MEDIVALIFIAVAIFLVWPMLSWGLLVLWVTKENKKHEKN